jgi:hypothetical protein
MTPRLRRWIFRPPPFRHHRSSCFKANPGHYNGDGTRCLHRFPACPALIVKIR